MVSLICPLPTCVAGGGLSRGIRGDDGPVARVTDRLRVQPVVGAPGLALHPVRVLGSMHSTFHARGARFPRFVRVLKSGFPEVGEALQVDGKVQDVIRL